MNAVRTATSALNTIARDRKNATPKTWAIGCGSLFLLCMVLWACNAALQATGIIKPPPTPTATAIPTDTAVPPTEEPEPTETERPTEDPEAEAVRDYMKWAMPIIAPLGGAMNDLGETLGQAGDSPAIIFTDDWRQSIVRHLTVLNVTAQAIRAKPQSEVPEAATDLHGQMLEMATKLDAIWTNLAGGIDNMDMDKIAAANQAMQDVSPLTAAMTEEIQKLGDKYGED